MDSWKLDTVFQENQTSTTSGYLAGGVGGGGRDRGEWEGGIANSTA